MWSFSSRCGLLAALAAALLGSVACNKTQLPTAPVAPEESPNFLISDGAHGGANPHFFFLPPVQPNPIFSGTFDAAVSPTVRICALTGSDCSGPDISTFSLTTTPAIVVDAAAENYSVQWKTNGLNLSTSVNYRIQVFVGDVLLGFADVDVVSSSKELKNVPAGFVGLVENKALQIKFRIETGIVGQVTVSPATATIEPEGTQQFVATLTDLHGNPLSGPPITWSSDNPGVGTVDGNGLATGVAEGTATITATSQNVSGTATLTVEAAGLEFVSLVAGTFHSCGVTTAGAAYCWGNNDNGQLGDGTTTDTNLPVAVSGDHTFASVSPALFHSCGLTTAGVAYCWGLNHVGQLGDGTTTSSSVPVAVAGGHTFGSVRAGRWHACGVDTAGAAFCWGDNNDGALGDGTDTDSSVPVAVTGGLTFASVGAGINYNCGLTTGGAAYCWGDGSASQLGNGTNTDSLVPVAVSGGYTFASVGVGDLHSCGVTTAGAAYCWGFNGSGGLGDGGSLDDRSVPVAVAGGHTFASVSAGYGHSCGVTTAGAAYCWGFNAEGGLGNGTNTGSNVPVAVSGGHTFASVSAGYYHSCGLTAAGAAYCWGDNERGGLGDGTNTDSNVPVAVSQP